MNNIIRGGIVAAMLAPAALIGAGPASATGDHGNGNPCPVSQRIPVYAQNGNPNGHFICGSVKGEKGDTGPAGPAGKPGSDGKDGKDSTVPGPAGETGPAGPQGPKGDDGAASTVPGPQGEQGPIGDTGPTGIGIPGLPGAPGEVGPAGPIGPQGIPGVDGATGPVGPQGDRGEATSSTGARGPAGKDGVTKTVVVEADGTTTTVGELPKTGGDDSALWLAIVGGSLVLAGSAGMIVYRKVRN